MRKPNEGFWKTCLLYRHLWDNNLVKEASNTFQLFALNTAITDTELQLRLKEIKLLLLLLLLLLLYRPKVRRGLIRKY